MTISTRGSLSGQIAISFQVPYHLYYPAAPEFNWNLLQVPFPQILLECKESNGQWSVFFNVSALNPILKNTTQRCFTIASKGLYKTPPSTTEWTDTSVAQT